MKYFIGIDVGTSGTKTILVSETGELIADSHATYAISHPHNGWAEQNPEDWREAVFFTLKEVVKKANAAKREIAGIGLSGQMHGLVMLNEAGEVLAPAIIWSDQRTEAQVAEMKTLLPEKEWLAITANPPIAAWTAAKILWMREHKPEVFAQCKHILLPKDYIRYVLTGEFITDVSDASGMQLMDVKNRCWSELILDKLEIDINMLPRICESTEPAGKLLPKVAAEVGLLETTIVAAGASDNAAAAIGMGVVEEGQAFVTVGTSAIIYTHLEEYVSIPQGQLHVCCAAVPGCWHTMGGPQAAGLSLNWFLDQFCLDYKIQAAEQGEDVFAVINEAVEKIKSGSEHLIYLPFLMGERTPNMDPNCRGVFFGLNTIHTQAHLLRAIMEGIGYSLADCNDILQACGTEVTQLRACGGGSRSNIWMQILAALLGCDITTLEKDEGPAFGAALLAGVAAGVYKDIREICKKLVTPQHTIRKKETEVALYKTYQAFYKTLYTHVKDDFTALQLLN
ncbi:MAG: xylulokinase [Christensenellaceae bacterium]|jgi:xylulokinase